ncbi:MAG: hypothetical protein QM779_00265, partial [Propionicimonas sp.]|uniref:hypothetical protein n=1 Tax=Propionicimonas sp. TaxID=1955623 RepID=UPI003D0DC199
LGEARHPLASPAALLLALGDARAAAGDDAGAARAWVEAAGASGDFAAMNPTDYSENTYFSILAARRSGDAGRAATLTDGLAGHIELLAATPATIDYFATSLPTLLLFHDDPQQARDCEVRLLRAELALLEGDHDAAAALLDRLLADDPSHELSLDLSRDLLTLRSHA